jgi:hypothetical protein
MTETKESMRFMRVIAAQLVLVICALTAAAQTNDIPAVPEDTPDFDFSLFFTGNLQGNIEPCG